MALKDIFKMIKADRYTADGCEEIKKAQNAIKEETADAGLPDGTMRHRKDGDYVKQAGKWVPAPAAKGKPEKGSKEDVKQRLGAYVKAMNKKNGEFAGKYKESKAKSDAMKQGQLAELNRASAKEKPANVMLQVQEDVKNKSPEEIKEIIGKLRNPNSPERKAANVNPDLLANVYEVELESVQKSDIKPEKKYEKPLYIMMNEQSGFYDKAKKERQRRVEELKNSPAEKRRTEILEKLDKGELVINPDTLKIEPKTSDSAPRELTGDCKVRVRKG